MSTRPWTRRLFAQSARAGRSAAARRRPVIEALEERALLTGYSAANVSDLIAAIVSSNTAGGANTITLTADTSSPYTLAAVDNTTDGATGLPVIAAGNVLTIVGGGDTIERSTADGTPAFRLLDVAAGATLNLQDLTLQNGLAVDSALAAKGGAIFSQGTLSLDTVNVQNNTVLSNSNGHGFDVGQRPQGGGIYALGGSVALTNCALIGNSIIDSQAPAFTFGGGLFVKNATATMVDCTITGNTSLAGGGGGLDVSSGATATLTGCTFTGNSVAQEGRYGSYGLGGGMESEAGSTVTLAGCTFTANSAGISGGGLQAEGTATLTGCTFTNNSAGDWGGGLTAENCALTGCTVSGNTAVASGGGLMLYYGTATLSQCIVTGNKVTGNNVAGGPGYGGGLDIGGAATLTDCTVSSNSAGDAAGLAFTNLGDNFGVTANSTLIGCTITGNTAADSAGGLEVGHVDVGNGSYHLVAATLTNCTINGNTAGTQGGGLAILLEGTASLVDCTVSGNSATSGSAYGGGAFVGGNYSTNNPRLGSLALTGCTVSGNSARDGGGVFNLGQATLTNTTVTGNVANRVGGGLYSRGPGDGFGTSSLTNCTVSANSGGGMDLIGRAVTTLNNTIVADQTTGGDFPAFIGNLTGSYDLFSDTIGPQFTSHSIEGDPQLAPLGNYGGPTQTMAVLRGSPAIDAGASGAGIPTTDQRGTARDAKPDIGAFEVSAAASLVVAGFPSPTTAGVAQALTVTALDAYGNVAADYTGTVTFTSSDGQAALPANYTFTSAIGGDLGEHTFSATLKTAGSQSITAADTVTGSITGNDSGITVNPAAASTLFVSGFPSVVIAGDPTSFTVTALDPFGNIATGYDGTLSFSSTDPKAVLPGDSSLTDGTGTFTATLESAGLRFISAVDTVNAGVSGTGSAISVHAATASSLLVTGFPSPATAGALESFTVTALDPFGNVATGFSSILHFSSSDVQATLPGLTLFVGEGSYTAALRTAGIQSITVSGGLLSGTESGISVIPAAASTLAVTGFPSSVVAGVAASFTVTAFDPYGNLATNDDATVNFSSSDSQATLPAGSTLTDGTGSFSATLKTAGSQSISASDGTASGSQSGITVSPAATRQFLVTGFPSPTTAGIAGSFTVTAEDPYGNATPAYNGKVKFTSSDGQASLPAKTKLTGGTGSFTATLSTAGTQSITATDTTTSTITGSQVGITVNPAAAAKLVFGQKPSDATAGAAISPAVTVIVEDQFDNVVIGNGSTVTLTLSAGTFEGGSSAATSAAVNGVATFGSLTIDAAGKYTVSATDGALAGTGASNKFTISPAATSTLVVTGFPSPVTAGTGGTITVTAEDAFGNTTPDYLGTVHFTSSDGQASLPSDYTFKTGNHGTRTFNATLKTAGTQSITATDTAAGTITGSQTGITVNPAAASKLIISAPPSAASGTPFSITVTAIDNYGNVATGYTGTVTFTSSDKQAVLPGDYTFSGADSGVHAFTVTLAKLGNQTITVRDTATKSINGTATVTVDSAPAVDLVFIPDMPTSSTTQPKRSASRKPSPIS